MPQPFLHLGDVGLVLEGIGSGGRPQRMHAEARDHLGEPELAGIALHDVLIDGRRVQGLGQGPGAVVFDGPEQGTMEVARRARQASRYAVISRCARTCSGR